MSLISFVFSFASKKSTSQQKNQEACFQSKLISIEKGMIKYRISANSFRRNYSILNLTLCTVTFVHSTYRCGNYSRAETIRGNTVFVKKFLFFYFCLMYCDLCSQYINVRKLFKGGNYMRKYISLIKRFCFE